MVVITDRNDLDDQLFGTFSRCQRAAAPAAGAGREPRAPARAAHGGSGRRGLHHHPEVLPRGEGRPSPDALRAAQHRGHRRRGPPQPVRLHRRLRPPHARRAAATPRSSASPARPSSWPTATPAPSSATTSASTTSSGPSRTGPPCRSTTRAAWPSSSWTRPSGPKIDPEFEEVTEGEEVERKEQLKTKWAQLEAIVGAEKRLQLVARDIVDHFEQRLEAMDGKAMVVCMSRRICVDLYNAIVALRPDWHARGR